jgi:LPS-assembly protein
LTSRSLLLAVFALSCASIASPAAGDEVEVPALRLDKQLRLAPARPERDAAKFLEADRIEGQPEKNVVATGNVVMRQRGATIRADRVDYSATDQVAIATGSVVLERGGDKAMGPQLRYELDNDTGLMETPTFEFPKTAERRAAYRGAAERAILGENQQSSLSKAEYTSCPAPRDDWFLRVTTLDIDGARNVGTAYNGTLYFLGVPILYAPYMSFPLDNKRRSGFLAPTFGTSGKSGFDMAVPYYINLAENYDATITPKIYTKRGLQLGAEGRYLGRDFAGQVDTEYLPNDRITDSDRYFVGLRHAQNLWGGWRAALSGQKVSDDDYFRDLSTRIAATSQTNLPRDAIVAYDDDVWSLSARALAYQTLQDPASPSPVPIPYRILPRLLALGEQQGAGGFDWRFLAELSNFKHETLVNGQRAILYPSIAFPMRRTYGYVTPRFGYYAMRYNMGEHANGLEETTLSLPVSSVDAGLYFDRQTSWGGKTYEQTLEPRLFYLNVPYRDQSRLPNFTTAERDFNYSQLFTENRFVGGDRVGDANQLTVALLTRLIESETGLERLRAALGQVYYFRPPRVTLGEPATDAKSSDIVAFASGRVTPSVGIDMSIQYTPNLARSQKLNVQSQYSPGFGSVVNVAYRYARGSIDSISSTDPTAQRIEQVDVSTQWPILRNVSALARWNWSIADKKLVEGLAGFEYNAGCWQVRAVAHRFITSTQQYSTSFQIQLELTGLSRIGINPLETLRQNISGYRRTDEISP